MTVEAPATPADPPGREDDTAAPSRPRLEVRVAAAFMALLPGALVIFFSFSAGGFFPSAVGFAALLVIQMVVLRVLVAESPFAGYTRRFGIVAGLFTAYAGWTLVSQLWSDTQDRALIEFDRALLYLVLLVLFGLLPRARWRMPWILRSLAAGILFVCTCALITRILPHVWPTSPGVEDNRLSFPLTYWNSLGILAAVGAILALGISANPVERRWVRPLAAAFVPVAATTLLFTFSRASMLALFIGLIAYVFVARSSTLVGALLAIVPPTVVALLVAYDADLLATTNPTSNAAVAQGKDVALAVAGAALAAALLRFLTLMIDRGLENRKRLRWTRRKARIVLAAGLVAVVLVAVAAGAPSWISNQYHAFVSGSPISTTDLRSRLTNPSSNGRTEHWRAAIKGFDASPIHGSGAGTYQFLWERNRRVTFPVIDAHSLYVEVLGELGVPGLLLILATIVTILATLRHRIRGPNRMVYAALFAAVLTWAIHAGVDWDWEMPAVTAWVFAVGGAALAGRASGRPATPMGDRGRIPIAAALLVVAVTPALLMLSQYRLQTAATAFDKGSCKPAKREAIASINILAVRPQPYQIVGYCDLDDGRVQEAVTAMQKAVEQEPKSWEYHYGLAIAQGFAGIDPRPELAVATGLNPKEDLLNQANKAFAQTGNSSTAWFKAAQQLNDATRVSGRLTLR